MTRNTDDDVSGIICLVWPNGCGHPELCQDECHDADLVSPVMPATVVPIRRRGGGVLLRRRLAEAGER